MLKWGLEDERDYEDVDTNFTYGFLTSEEKNEIAGDIQITVKGTKAMQEGIRGSLGDRRMGPPPGGRSSHNHERRRKRGEDADKEIMCGTCGLPFGQCSGHLGKMQLPTAIFNHDGEAGVCKKKILFVLRRVCLHCCELLNLSEEQMAKRRKDVVDADDADAQEAAPREEDDEDDGSDVSDVSDVSDDEEEEDQGGRGKEKATPDEKKVSKKAPRTKKREAYQRVVSTCHMCKVTVVKVEPNRIVEKISGKSVGGMGTAEHVKKKGKKSSMVNGFKMWYLLKQDDTVRKKTIEVNGNTRTVKEKIKGKRDKKMVVVPCSYVYAKLRAIENKIQSRSIEEQEAFHKKIGMMNPSSLFSTIMLVLPPMLRPDKFQEPFRSAGGCTIAYLSMLEKAKTCWAKQMQYLLYLWSLCSSETDERSASLWKNFSPYMHFADESPAWERFLEELIVTEECMGIRNLARGFMATVCADIAAVSSEHDLRKEVKYYKSHSKVSFEGGVEKLKEVLGNGSASKIQINTKNINKELKAITLKHTDEKKQLAAIKEAREVAMNQLALAWDHLMHGSVDDSLNREQSRRLYQPDLNDFDGLWNVLSGKSNTSSKMGGGKFGLFRRALIGKQISMIARGVILPDSNLSHSEIGLPSRCFEDLSLECGVWAGNVEEILRELTRPIGSESAVVFDRAKAYVELRAVHVSVSNSVGMGGDESDTETENQERTQNLIGLLQHGKKWDLRFGGTTAKERETLKHVLRLVKDGSLYREGWAFRARRKLREGDVVIVTRQPLLQRANMTGLRAVCIPALGAHFFRVNPGLAGMFNLDFDGDQLNLVVPQDEMARAEVTILQGTTSLMVSPNGACLIQPAPNTALGIYLLTSSGVDLHRIAGATSRLNIEELYDHLRASYGRMRSCLLRDVGRRRILEDSSHALQCGSIWPPELNASSGGSDAQESVDDLSSLSLNQELSWKALQQWWLRCVEKLIGLCVPIHFAYASEAKKKINGGDLSLPLYFFPKYANSTLTSKDDLRLESQEVPAVATLVAGMNVDDKALWMRMTENDGEVFNAMTTDYEMFDWCIPKHQFEIVSRLQKLQPKVMYSCANGELPLSWSEEEEEYEKYVPLQVSDGKVSIQKEGISGSVLKDMQDKILHRGGGTWALAFLESVQDLGNMALNVVNASCSGPGDLRTAIRYPLPSLNNTTDANADDTPHQRFMKTMEQRKKVRKAENPGEADVRLVPMSTAFDIKNVGDDGDDDVFVTGGLRSCGESASISNSKFKALSKMSTAIQPPKPRDKTMPSQRTVDMETPVVDSYMSGFKNFQDFMHSQHVGVRSEMEGKTSVCFLGYMSRQLSLHLAPYVAGMNNSVIQIRKKREDPTQIRHNLLQVEYGGDGLDPHRIPESWKDEGMLDLQELKRECEKALQSSDSDNLSNFFSDKKFESLLVWCNQTETETETKTETETETQGISHWLRILRNEIPTPTDANELSKSKFKTMIKTKLTQLMPKVKQEKLQNFIDDIKTSNDFPKTMMVLKLVVDRLRYMSIDYGAPVGAWAGEAIMATVLQGALDSKHGEEGKSKDDLKRLFEMTPPGHGNITMRYDGTEGVVEAEGVNPPHRDVLNTERMFSCSHLITNWELDADEFNTTLSRVGAADDGGDNATHIRHLGCKLTITVTLNEQDEDQKERYTGMCADLIKSVMAYNRQPPPMASGASPPSDVQSEDQPPPPPSTPARYHWVEVESLQHLVDEGEAKITIFVYTGNREFRSTDEVTTKLEAYQEWTGCDSQEVCYMWLCCCIGDRNNTDSLGAMRYHKHNRSQVEDSNQLPSIERLTPDKRQQYTNDIQEWKCAQKVADQGAPTSVSEVAIARDRAKAWLENLLRKRVKPRCKNWWRLFEPALIAETSLPSERQRHFMETYKENATLSNSSGPLRHVQEFKRRADIVSVPVTQNSICRFKAALKKPSKITPEAYENSALVQQWAARINYEKSLEVCPLLSLVEQMDHKVVTTDNTTNKPWDDVTEITIQEPAVAKTVGLTCANLLLEQRICNLFEVDGNPPKLRVDLRHIRLLCDAMSFKGEPQGVRYTDVKYRSPLEKCAYERHEESLNDAAMQNHNEYGGPHMATMFNLRIPVGTGTVMTKCTDNDILATRSGPREFLGAVVPLTVSNLEGDTSAPSAESAIKSNSIQADILNELRKLSTTMD